MHNKLYELIVLSNIQNTLIYKIWYNWWVLCSYKHIVWELILSVYFEIDYFEKYNM